MVNSYFVDCLASAWGQLLGPNKGPEVLNGFLEQPFFKLENILRESEKVMDEVQISKKFASRFFDADAKSLLTSAVKQIFGCAFYMHYYK